VTTFYPATLIFAVLIFGGLFIFWLIQSSRETPLEACPHCHANMLEVIHFLRATVVINGKRAPDSYFVYHCSNCKKPYQKSLRDEIFVELEDEA
jgi:hypothetical protein